MKADRQKWVKIEGKDWEGEEYKKNQRSLGFQPPDIYITSDALKALNHGKNSSLA